MPIISSTPRFLHYLYELHVSEIHRRIAKQAILHCKVKRGPRNQFSLSSTQWVPACFIWTPVTARSV